MRHSQRRNDGPERQQRSMLSCWKKKKKEEEVTECTGAVFLMFGYGSREKQRVPKWINYCHLFR